VIVVLNVGLLVELMMLHHALRRVSPTGHSQRSGIGDVLLRLVAAS